MGKFWQDLRRGALMLAETPGFALAVLPKPLLYADPAAFAEVAVFLTGVAQAARSVPARRVMKIARDGCAGI